MLKRLRVLVPGLVLAMTAIGGAVLAAAPAGANTHKYEVLLQDMPGVVPGGETHYKFLETKASEIYVFMYGTDSGTSHIDLYVCRSGGPGIDGADHAYGEVDLANGHGGWAGTAWGDESTVGNCGLFQSNNLMGGGSPTDMKFIVADNYHTTTRDINIAYVSW